MEAGRNPFNQVNFDANWKGSQHHRSMHYEELVILAEHFQYERVHLTLSP